jgi:hypothetical protein
MEGLSPLYLSVFFYTVEKWGQVNSSRHLYICAYTYASSCINWTCIVPLYRELFGFLNVFLGMRIIVNDVKLSFANFSTFQCRFKKKKKRVPLLFELRNWRSQLLVWCYCGYGGVNRFFFWPNYDPNFVLNPKSPPFYNIFDKLEVVKRWTVLILNFALNASSVFTVLESC